MQKILDYTKTLKFWVINEEKTRAKYANYKTTLYNTWLYNTPNSIIDDINEDFKTTELVWLMKAYSYEYTLCERLHSEEKFKENVRYLRTWAKAKFYNALIWIVQYHTDCTDAEAKNMASRIYMTYYNEYNIYMQKEFYEFIEYVLSSNGFSWS